MRVTCSVVLGHRGAPAPARYPGRMPVDDETRRAPGGRQGFFDGMLVRHLWAVVAVVSAQVITSVALWLPRREGASSGPLALAWVAYVVAVAAALASLAVALGPVRRARSDGARLRRVVVAIVLVVAAAALGAVPTNVLPPAA